MPVQQQSSDLLIYYLEIKHFFIIRHHKQDCGEIMHCALSVRKEEPRGVERKGRLSRQQTRRLIIRRARWRNHYSPNPHSKRSSFSQDDVILETLSDFVIVTLDFYLVSFSHRIHLQVLFSPLMYYQVCT